MESSLNSGIHLLSNLWEQNALMDLFTRIFFCRHSNETKTEMCSANFLVVGVVGGCQPLPMCQYQQIKRERLLSAHQDFLTRQCVLL
jgi:hypothetical protein